MGGLLNEDVEEEEETVLSDTDDGTCRITACELCGTPDDAAAMLRCSACGLWFQVYCVAQMLTAAVPQGRWQCLHCDTEHRQEATDIALGVRGVRVCYR